MHHGYHIAGRRGHQINLRIYVLQFLFQYHHGKHAGTGRHISGAHSHAVGGRHAGACVALRRTHGNTGFQISGCIKKLCPFFCQDTCVLSRHQSLGQDITQLPWEILSCHQLVKLLHALLVKIPGMDVHREHACHITNAQNTSACQLPVHISLQRNEVVDILHAGEHGGEIVHSGSFEELLKNTKSITGDYMAGRRSIEVPASRRPVDKERQLIVRGARENNLKNVTVSFPLGVFTAVTGVSGSGKSTLVNDILYTSLANKLNGAKQVPGRHKSIDGLEHLDKVIHVDQSPIGRTPRSNPATYTGVFDHIRKLFAETSEAKMRGYTPGRFSFNVKGGRCEDCSGDGTLKIEMNFLPDVYVPCETCHGKRYNRETLEVHYKGKTIADVLEMPVEEAAEFFAAFTPIARHLNTLVDVGLGYIRLGQPATTLSGGEAQRVKLATELQKRSNGRSIYVLDEPTTGLHFEDIRKLLAVLQSLVDKGNSVITIEHNLDVVKCADWIIDMGPEGGSGGGTVIAEGTPEQVAQVKGSHTGAFLAEIRS